MLRHHNLMNPPAKAVAWQYCEEMTVHLDLGVPGPDRVESSRMSGYW